MTSPYHHRVTRDLNRRSMPGIPVYLILWTIVVWASEACHGRPDLALAAFAVFTAVALARWWHYRRFDRELESHPRRTRALLAAGIAVPAGLWSLAFVDTMLQAGNPDLKIVFIMVTSGLAGGGVNSYAPDRRWSAAYALLLLLPTALALLALRPADRDIALLILVYIAFLLILGSRSTREYRQALENETRLEAQTRELERLNQNDGLTGIRNRRYFDQALATEWRRAFRQDMENLCLVREGQHVRGTVSIGLAGLVPDRRQSPESLVAAADAALYQAKRKGRNRAVVGALPAAAQARPRVVERHR